MKRTLAVLALMALVGATALSAPPLAREERTRLLDHLKKTEKMLKDATRGLSAEQWKYKAAPDRWSVADCVEHLALTEEFLFNMAANNVMKSPAVPVDPAAAREGDEWILKVIPDRSNKAQAPEPLRPSGKWATPQEALKAFFASRKKTLEYVRKTQDDLRAHKANAPFGRSLDGYHWLLLVSAHTERHTAQALEVKADPNFPKKKSY
jgi:hypothetical protein